MITKKMRGYFLRRHAANCSPEELFRNYIYYFDKYSGKHSQTDIEGLGDCLWYLKKLISKFPPEKLKEIVERFENDSIKENQSVEQITISLMHRVSLIEMYYKDYQSSAHWAKKTLEMINYFHPHFNYSSIQQLINGHPIYSDCESIFKEYYSYFHPETHQELVFKWEQELLKSS